MTDSLDLFDSERRKSQAYTVVHEDAEALADPVIDHVYSYWRSIGGGLVPFRNAFEFMDVYKAAPHLALIHHIGASCFRYVFFGTALVDLFGTDFTGDEISPARPSITGAGDWPSLYNRILEDRQVIIETRNVVDVPRRENLEAHTLKCPLADDDGTPAFVLNCVVPLDRTSDALF